MVAIFYWSIVALECCVSFCYTMKSNGYIYTYIPSPLALAPTPPASCLSMSSQSSQLSSVLYSRFIFTVCFTHGSVFVNPNLPIDPTLPFPPPPGVHMSTLYACVSIPGLQRGSSVPNVISIFFFF